ncbi:heat shock factor protein 5 isoform X3 [Megalobrama amblycephala]|uniref:heat shock factor protein 5 isoform X3 n=1 Tax=Megalobrama amblycephala TaxID=75352 RepID=UPI002013FE8A|nr:heat shock factor protein 5 isoform X3 [Megalobrama amblycephala]
MDMEFDKSLLTVHINYNNFPAKLWCLTNDPENNSVFWSPSGDSLIVDQQRFEDELLSPVKQDAKLFKTTHFTSFIRQLNLYGFRKLFDGPSKDRHRNLHQFHNPYFKQGRPELLVHLKRLTISNKAKMQAGEDVTCRPPSRGHQQRRHNTTEEKTTGSAHQYQHISHHQPKGFDRSLIPPQSWIFPCSDVSPFYSNKGIPVSVIRPYPYSTPHRAQSSPAALFPQEAKYIPHHLSYPPGFYPPVVCQCCTAGFMEADRTSGDQTSLSYAHYAYYPNYSVSHHHNSIQTANWPAHGTPEAQRADVNLDRVFQMVDEFQGLPNVHIVRVGTPVKPQHSSGSPVSTLPAEADSPQSSRSETAVSSPQRDVRWSTIASGVSTQYIKLESEGHEVENQGPAQLKEHDSTSLESSEKATDQKLTAEQDS